MSGAGRPNLDEWIDGQWDGYTPDQLLDVLLAQPVWAEGEGVLQAEGIVHAQLGFVWERVVTLTRGPVTRDREVAALLLSQHLIDPQQRIRQSECRDLLRRMLSTESEPAPLAAVIHGIGELVGEADPSRAVELVVPFATHQDEMVRFSVAAALAGVDDDRAVATLVHLCADSDADVRDWAAFGLGAQSDVDTASVRDALASLLDDEDASVMYEALLGLVRRADSRVVPQLLEYLTQQDDTVVAEWSDLREAMDEALQRWESTGYARVWLPVLEQLQTRNLWDTGAISTAIARCRSAAP